MTRRQIARAGLAAPVVVTLMNRAALATGGGDTPGDPFNCTISGWVQLGLSIAPSGAQHRVACEGKSPGYWKNKTFNGKGTWSSSQCRYKDGVKFATIFGAPPVPDGLLSTYPTAANYSLGDVLNSEDIRNCRGSEKNSYPNLNGSLAFHAVAVYLNSIYTVGLPLSLLEITEMYKQTYNGGTYSAGMADLSAADIQRFWESTYHGNALSQSYWYTGAGV